LREKSFLQQLIKLNKIIIKTSVWKSLALLSIYEIGETDTIQEMIQKNKIVKEQ
jgi:hypothetical protein